MTMRLIIMRHAKSDWNSGAASDHARPLNKRGRRDAPRVANRLGELGWQPDYVISSDSRRTRETLELMLPHLNHGSDPTVDFSLAALSRRCRRTGQPVKGTAQSSDNRAGARAQSRLGRSSGLAIRRKRRNDDCQCGAADLRGEQLARGSGTRWPLAPGGRRAAQGTRLARIAHNRS